VNACSNVIYSCDGRWISVSHDPSEITLIWWFAAQKNISDYYRCYDIFYFINIVCVIWYAGQAGSGYADGSSDWA